MNIFFIIFLLIAYIGFFCKKNFYFYLMIIWLWLMASFNNGGPDYKTYELIFSTTSAEILDFNFLKGERIFYLGMYFFNLLKMTFFEYSFVLSTSSLIIVLYLIKKYTKNGVSKSFILSCMYLFPMIDNIIQRRNFIASGLIALGIVLLIEKRKFYKIKFFLLILIAYNIHNSMILYLIFFLAPLFSIKQIRKLSISLMLIIGFILPIFPTIIYKIFPFYSSKISLYLENIENRLPLEKVIFFAMIHLGMFFLVNYSSKNIEKDKYVEFVLKINYISLIFIPFYYYNLIFFRIYRNLFIYFYILIANNLKESKVKKKLILILILQTYLILLFTIFYISSDKYFRITEPLFTDNKFLNLF